MDRNKIEELAQIACEFQGESKKRRELTQEEYKRNEPGDLSAIRLVLDGQLSTLAMRFTEKIEATSEKISYKLSLSASFFRTYYVINDLILTGDIIEALTLIRKQLENLTRLIEIDNKPLSKLNRKTPNVINTLKKMGKALYIELSEIAHFGTPRVGEIIKAQSKKEGKIGPSIFPKYSVNLYEAYKMHSAVGIYFAFWSVEFLESIYKEKYCSDEDNNVLNEIFTKAFAAGIFLDDESKYEVLD